MATPARARRFATSPSPASPSSANIGAPGASVQRIATPFSSWSSTWCFAPSAQRVPSPSLAHDRADPRLARPAAKVGQRPRRSYGRHRVHPLLEHALSQEAARAIEAQASAESASPNRPPIASTSTCASSNDFATGSEPSRSIAPPEPAARTVCGSTATPDPSHRCSDSLLRSPNMLRFPRGSCYAGSMRPRKHITE